MTAIPSPRHQRLVREFAAQPAVKLGLPFFPAAGLHGGTPEQKTLNNSSLQAQNAESAGACNANSFSLGRSCSLMI